MNKGPHAPAEDDLELSLDTLDQWETELDQFAAGIMQRLSFITGKAVDTTGLIPQSSSHAQSDPADGDDQDAEQILQTLRDMTQ